MKHIRLFLVGIIGLVFIGAGCASTTPDKPTVAATIFPLYDLVRIIGGDDITVELILPPGASPHTYEPTPSTIKQLQGVSRIFQIGHGLDGWAASIGNSIPGSSLVTVDRNIELRESAELHGHEEEGEAEGHESEQGAFDPHYWLDPTNAYIIVDTIVLELASLDPAHTNDFALRAEDFKDELEKKDFEWLKMMSEVTNRNIVTFHDAFMYFAARFQLNVVATFEPFPGKEPTPQYLINLKEEIDEYKVNTLYIEPQFAESSLTSFAHDNNLSIGVLDPEGSKDRTSYLEMIDYNVKTIVEHQK